eukprot:COSAG02_NODE_11827_length_1646_cov_4.280543_1_plen_331_part_10
MYTNARGGWAAIVDKSKWIQCVAGQLLVVSGTPSRQTCLECPYSHRCNGGPICLGNSTGELCADCEAKYFNDHGFCTPCATSYATTAAFVAFGAVLGLGIVWKVTAALHASSCIVVGDEAAAASCAQRLNTRTWTQRMLLATANAFAAQLSGKQTDDTQMDRGLLLKTLRDKLEPRLKEHEMVWEDVRPVVHLVADPNGLRQAITGPAAFWDEMMSASGSVGKRLALAKLRSKLKPKLVERDLTWEDVLPAIEMLADMERLKQALNDPGAFMSELLSAVGPVGKKLALAKLRPKLEPRLARHDLAWDDVLPAVELISTLDELQKAATEPDA